MEAEELPPGEEEEERQGSLSAAQKVRKLFEYISSLTKEKETAEEQLKQQNLELEKQKQLVLEFTTKCEKLQETVKSVESRRDEQERFQVTNLQEKLEKSESSFVALQEEHKKVLVKHKHLRKSVQQLLENVKKAVTENVTVPEKPANLTQKLERLESSREELVLEVQKNLNMISSIVKLLGIRIPKTVESSTASEDKMTNVKNKYKCKRCDQQFLSLVQWNRHRQKAHKVKVSKGIPCRSCGKMLLSMQKLQEHRLNLHVVQNSKKFLKRKRSSKIKLTFKKAKGNMEQDTWNIVPSSRSVSEEDYDLCGNDDMENSVTYEPTETVPENQADQQPTIPPLEPHDVPNNAPHNINSDLEDSVDEGDADQPMQIISENQAEQQPTISPLESQDIPNNGTQGTSEPQEIQEEVDMPREQEGTQDFLDEGDVDEPAEIIPENHADQQPTFPSLETPDIPQSSPSSEPQEVQHEVDKAKEKEGHFCLCGLQTSNKWSLANHIRYHTTEKRFFCQICEIAFRTEHQQLGHVRAKHPIKRAEATLVNCEVCGKRFRSQENLTNHQLAAHRPDIQPVTASESDVPIPTTSTRTRFSNQGTSLEQPVTHAVDTAFSYWGFFCTCGRESPTWKALTQHIRRYNPQATFNCSKCPRSYSGYNDLRKHMRRKHEMDCPGWGCRNCGEIFPTQDEFHVHRSSKSCRKKPQEQLPSKRKVTRRVIRVSKAERTKLPTVSNSKPKAEEKFKCKFCPRTFILLLMLQSHVKRTHKQANNVQSPKKFGCTLCRQKFDSVKLLHEHCKTRHLNAPPSTNNSKNHKSLSKKKQTLKNKATPLPGNDKEPKPNYFVTGKKHERDLSKRHGWYCQCGSRYKNTKLLARHVKHFATSKKTSVKNTQLKEKSTCGCSECGACFSTMKGFYQHRWDVHSFIDPALETSKSQTSRSPSIPAEETAPVMEPPPPPPPPEQYSSPKYDGKPIFSSLPSQIVDSSTNEHGISDSEGTSQISCKCGMLFGNLDTLYAHVRYFVLEKSFRCSFCGKLFYNFKDMNAHLRGVHHTEPDPNLLGCPSCGVIFATKQEYRRHMIMKTSDDKKFQNRCCPMTLLIQSPEKTSEPSTSEPVEPERRFACCICDKRFLFPNTLESHLTQVHKIVDTQTWLTNSAPE